MVFPLVKGEKPTKTALKAYLVLMQEDEAWHKEILSIQKDHKNILFTLPSGQKLDGMHEDPIVALERELQYEKQYSNNKTSGPKVIELGPDNAVQITGSVKATGAAQEGDKSYGKFSFLGSEDTQKQLVEEFLNRNKKKSEESQVKADGVDAKKEETKQEDVKTADVTKIQVNEEQVEVAKEDEPKPESNIISESVEVVDEKVEEVKVDEPVKEAEVDEPNEDNEHYESFEQPAEGSEPQNDDNNDDPMVI
jgi:hypothetical protein